MTGLWFPPATVDPIAGHNGAGPFLTGNPKIVHHITVGSSYAGARGAYAATGNLPHFTTSNVGGVFRVWQHLPVDVAATALVHPFGTPETNRAHAIQIEHVAPSLDSVRAWPGNYLDGIGMLCRWIEATVGVLRRADYPFDSPPRLSWMQWGSAVGHLGHCHVPANDHMDPGPIDIGRILAAGQPQPAPAPAPAPVITNYPEEQVQTIDTQTNPLDDQGNGYLDEGIDPHKVFSVVFNVGNPPDDKGYPSVPPRWGRRMQDGQTRIVFYGGTPHANFGCTVWSAS